jgi:hypothetical protein
VRNWRLQKGREVVREEHHHTESLVEKIPPEILAQFEEMKKRLLKLEKTSLEHEESLQLILQSAMDAKARSEAARKAG